MNLRRGSRFGQRSPAPSGTPGAKAAAIAKTESVTTLKA
jgi:hypothetical protein